MESWVIRWGSQLQLVRATASQDIPFVRGESRTEGGKRCSTGRNFKGLPKAPADKKASLEEPQHGSM